MQTAGRRNCSPASCCSSSVLPKYSLPVLSISLNFVSVYYLSLVLSRALTLMIVPTLKLRLQKECSLELYCARDEVYKDNG